MQAHSIEQLLAADAILLGRATYQIWAAFWPSAPRNEPFADRMDAIPKYVVSKTLRQVGWKNSILLSGDVVAEVTKLKEGPGGDILIYGSADLVNSLTKHDLIDEYRLMVYPVLGAGSVSFGTRPIPRICDSSIRGYPCRGSSSSATSRQVRLPRASTPRRTPGLTSRSSRSRRRRTRIASSRPSSSPMPWIPPVAPPR